MIKVLADTNVFIYALDKSSIYHEKANNILADENLELYTSSKNISEYFAVCTKLQIKPEIMLGFYEDIKTNIHIIYPSPASQKHFDRLIKKYTPKGNQVFDMEIVSIMLQHDVQFIATFNIKDFNQVTEVKILEQ